MAWLEHLQVCFCCLQGETCDEVAVLKLAHKNAKKAIVCRS
ncbi:hypothetical protein [Streptomyces sp. NPDC059398]